MDRVRWRALSVGILVTVPSVPAVAGTSRPSLRLTRALPGVVRVGETVTVGGRAHDAGPSVAALQGRTSGGWRILARAALPARGERFRLSWTPPPNDSFHPLMLRVAILARGRLTVATPPVQSIVGPAPVPCATPVPPAVDIPVGDGWIVGGSSIEGGPAPGIDACQSDPYTVTATAVGTGVVAATQTVAGGHSYTLVVPAGRYTLKAGNCFTLIPVTVTAGKQTTADANCDVP